MQSYSDDEGKMPKLYRLKELTDDNDALLLAYYSSAMQKIRPQINPGDYMDENGLYHCCKCNGVKQLYRPLMSGIQKVTTFLCPCQVKQRDTLVAQQLADSKNIERAHRRARAFHDTEYRGWTFSLDDGKNPELMRVAKAYAENFAEMYGKGKGLLFFGNVGVGKTFAAAAIVNYVLDNFNYFCLVTNMTRIGSAVQKEKDPQGYLDMLNDYDLLVLDDIRAERDTPWMKELVHSVVDSRYMSGKPLIVTTNLTEEELLHPEDRSWQRTYSRLYEMCKPVNVKFSDRRKTEMIKSAREMDRLLGLTEGK